MKMTLCIAAVAALLMVGCAASPDARMTDDMVANADPYEIGIAGVSVSGFTGIGMSDSSLTISFAPRTNEVILVTSNQGNETHIFMDRESRDSVMNGAVRYLEEFEAKTLSEDENMLDAYGEFKAFMKWGMLTLNAEGTATVSVGYEFLKKAPFFVLTIPETANDRYTSTLRQSPVQRSGYFQIYFTRSQLTDFVEYLVQENLESTLEEKNVSRASTDPDEY